MKNEPEMSSHQRDAFLHYVKNKNLNDPKVILKTILYAANVLKVTESQLIKAFLTLDPEKKSNE